MTDTISKKLESKLDGKLAAQSKRIRLDDGFKKGKVINEVLDKLTVMTLYKMISDHIIAYVNGSVSAGKESVLFWGVSEDGTDVALKIYLVSTSNFKKREQYILGDPRFSHLRRGTKNLVYLWAKKSFVTCLSAIMQELLSQDPYTLKITYLPWNLSAITAYRANPCYTVQ